MTAGATADATAAMNVLGALLAEQGETEDSHVWWLEAAEGGDAEAMNSDSLLKEESEEERAQAWYQKANANSGPT